MLDTKKIDKIVFLDIETTSLYPTFKSMPVKWQELFKRRFKKEFGDIDLNMPPDVVEDAYEVVYSTKAPLMPEFGRILCISCGILKESGEEYELKAVTYSNEDEVALLASFIKGMSKVLDQSMLNPEWHICCHNSFVFDIPFIGKRMLYNKMSIPKFFDIAESKPWDIKGIIDTKAIMKWGVYDHHVALDILAGMFGLESSKSDMDGSMVKDVYWVDKDLERIKKYCEMDIKVLAECVLHMKGLHNKKVVIK